MMPTCRDDLEYESLASEADLVSALVELLSCESVAVRGEVTFHVWARKPAFTKQVVFHHGKLTVERFRDEKVSAVADVLY